MIFAVKGLFVIVALVIAVFLALRLKEREDRREEDQWKINWKVAPLSILIFVSSLVMIASAGQVGAGTRGVVLKFGAVTGRTLGEGIYFVTPFVNTVEMMDVQTHAYEAHAAAASKDLQDVSTKVTLNYALDPKKVNEIYQNLRRDYMERIAKPAVQESVKAVTARFNAEELITKRPEVKAAIEESLKDRLSYHGIVAETVSITDFSFSPSFTAAIEAKVSAVQKALEAENKLRQIEVEARQVEAAAKGQANAAIAVAEGQKQSAIKMAEGDAQATLTRAEAQTQANVMLANSLRDQPDLLKYVLYQTIGPDVKVIILPNGQEFILSPELLGGK